MSYILEALKKAETERRSANIPSIHTTHSVAVPGKSTAWRHRLTIAAVAGGAIATTVWYYTSRQSAPAPVVQIAAAPTLPPAAPSSPAPAATTAAATTPAEQPAPKEKPAKKPVAKKSATESPKPEPAPVEQMTLATLQELPEQIQRAVPALEVGGYIYSGNKADRSVLINKRLLREGDEVAPGLTLEQLMSNGMVLNFQGNRFRASY